MELSQSPHSLGTDEIALLLRVLRFHGEQLDSVELDSRRWTERNQRPSYIIDHRELQAYIHDSPGDLEIRILVEYLLNQSDIRLILGPGTVVELAEHVRNELPQEMSGLLGMNDLSGELGNQPDQLLESVENIAIRLQSILPQSANKPPE